MYQWVGRGPLYCDDTAGQGRKADYFVGGIEAWRGAMPLQPNAAWPGAGRQDRPSGV